MDDEQKLSICFALILIGALIGGISMMAFEEWGWQRDAIKRGYAEYNQTTGAWQWKEQPEQPKEQSQ